MLSTLKSLHKITRYYHAIETRGCILGSYKREMWFVYDFFFAFVISFWLSNWNTLSQACE